MGTWKFPPQVARWIDEVSAPLHGRLAWRLLPLLAGLLFAQGRRTVACCLRANALSQNFKPFYYFLGSLGRCTEGVASRLLRLVTSRLPLTDRLLFALDDTPTKRAGPCVEGAGIHHNPTPGRAAQKFLYGHVWVTVAWVVNHPHWGVLGLPLRALLYVRQKDLAQIVPWNRDHFPFRTKLELAAELVTWVAQWLRYLGKTLWFVVDGAYAKRPFLKAAAAAGVVVVSRLRKDAALRGVPVPPRPGDTPRRGRKPKYGKRALSLAKRAAHQRGWQQAEMLLYSGKQVTKTFKSVRATYAPAGGLIRVVLTREESDWVAFFCTDPNATAQEILKAVADRSVIEQDFHDIKEVHGAGQQQVRHIWANVAAYHLTLWLHTLIELWAWDQPAKQLRDRSASPWDDPARRPSHADRRNALRRACIQQTFSPSQGLRVLTRKSRALVRSLLRLVA
jgi:hypothetical protein